MTDIQLPQTEAVDALLQQAVALHQVGQLQEAEQLYRRILQAFPKHVDANYNLGLIATQTGHHAPALKHLQVAYEAFPANLPCILAYANALGNQGYLLDAMKVIKTARQQTPDDDDLKKVQRQLDEAIKLALENPSPNQKEWEPIVELFNEQKWVELETRAQKLSGQYKRCGKVWTMLFIARQAQGKAFIDDKRKAAQFSPTDTSLQVSLCSDLMQLGRHEEVEQLLRNQIKVNKDSELAHYNLGIFLSSMNRSLESISSLNHALEINPSYISALCALGQLFVKSGHNEKATALFEQALAVETTNVEEICTLAQTLLALGQFSPAAAQFQKALELNPNHLSSLNDFGIALKALGHRDDAEKCFYRAIELQPGFILAINNLGQMRHEAGDLENALLCFDRALALEPNSQTALFFLGLISVSKSKFEQAVEYLQRASNLSPNDPVVHCNLGLALQGLGQVEPALRCFQHAVSCKPDFAYAIANIGGSLGLLGQIEGSHRALTDALAMDPQDPRILSLALMHIPYKVDDARFSQLETLYAQRGQYGNNERRFLCRAYAKAMEQAGATDKAFAAMQEAEEEAQPVKDTTLDTPAAGETTTS